jgi:hypothetical protein
MMVSALRHRLISPLTGRDNPVVYHLLPRLIGVLVRRLSSRHTRRRRHIHLVHAARIVHSIVIGVIIFRIHDGLRWLLLNIIKCSIGIVSLLLLLVMGEAR